MTRLPIDDMLLLLRLPDPDTHLGYEGVRSSSWGLSNHHIQQGTRQQWEGSRIVIGGVVLAWQEPRDTLL